jgi:hypothetical protein
MDQRIECVLPMNAALFEADASAVCRASYLSAPARAFKSASNRGSSRAWKSASYPRVHALNEAPRISPPYLRRSNALQFFS